MDLGRHKKDFTWQSEKDGDAIEMAFSKKKVDARKTWLRHYEVRLISKAESLFTF